MAEEASTQQVLDSLQGTPAHSGQIFKPEVGAGAVFEASRVVADFYRQMAGEQYLTFNPGLAAAYFG